MMSIDMETEPVSDIASEIDHDYVHLVRTANALWRRS